MIKKEKTNKINFYKILFFLILATFFISCLFIVLFYTQSDSVGVKVFVPNEKPEITRMFISEKAYALENDFFNGINLISGNNKKIHINGVITDKNGTQDIDYMEALFFRKNVEGGSSCSKDFNNCYKTEKCSLVFFTDTSKKYNCEIDLSYMSDATDYKSHYSEEEWVALIKVFDKSNTFTEKDLGVEVNSLLSINFPKIINYEKRLRGTKSYGYNNEEFTFVQRGNTKAQVLIVGEDMYCDQKGIISTYNQEWFLHDFDYGQGNKMPRVLTETGLILERNENDHASVSSNLYFNIHVPYYVFGTCTGNTTILIEEMR